MYTVGKSEGHMIFKCNNVIISLLVQYYSTKTNNIIILDPRWNQDGSEMINPRSPHSPHHCAQGLSTYRIWNVYCRTKHVDMCVCVCSTGAAISSVYPS